MSCGAATFSGAATQLEAKSRLTHRSEKGRVRKRGFFVLLIENPGLVPHWYRSQNVTAATTPGGYKFGEERSLPILEQGRSLESSTVLRHVEQAVEEFRAGELDLLTSGAPRAKSHGLGLRSSRAGFTAGVRSILCGPAPGCPSSRKRFRSNGSGRLRRSRPAYRKRRTGCAVRLQSPQRSG